MNTNLLAFLRGFISVGLPHLAIGTRSLVPIVACLIALPMPPANGAIGTLHLVVREEGSPEPLPCRVHLRDAQGDAVRPPHLPFWRDHFVFGGEIELNLAPGDYSYEVDRGPEYQLVTGTIRVVDGERIQVRRELQRLTHLSREGWWSGDLHIHRPIPDIELLIRAEDLHIAPVITWWNSRGPWETNPLPRELVIPMDDHRFYAPVAGEDERGGGALLYFNLREPMPLDRRHGREHPSSSVFLEQAKSMGGTLSGAPVWAEIEKPFWWDTPIWLASGLVDSVGIAHNHMHRGGVLENEAWGRPRNREVFPAPQGNGRYTQQLYYHILNCGLRIPPSAGSASGVLPNPVGYNRVFVHLDGELTWRKWWEGLRAGRVFVSNGPLLRARANNQMPGHVFRSRGPITVRLETRLDSREPILQVELVSNGRVERLPFPAVFSIQESGWFLVRAVADVTNTFRFASTGPWYVEIGDHPARIQRESAEFFLNWTRTRREAVAAALSDPGQRAEAVAPIDAAEAFWQAKVDAAVTKTVVTGEVVDSWTERPIPSRIYVQDEQGRWFFPQSPDGSAIRYERQNWVNPNAFEHHTTLSAHPFRLELEPGSYTVTVERGKEYRPLVRKLEVGSQEVQLRLALERWVNMADRGWFSGDTHLHRSLEELPNVMAAEDLNVAFPLTHWVTRAHSPPTQGDKNSHTGAGPELIASDPFHVIWPLNTEYEIFTVNGRSHTLGAVFVLGHRTPLIVGAPPVSAITAHARREGALLDLDKHNWPWSLALIPTMGVDLYELANNHHWRTEFGITNWATPAPKWMKLSHTDHGNEQDWTFFTFRTYYALLNSGFRLRPTAGTASGVHPVPLGFGRVYVHLPRGFSYQDWFQGLNRGESFVTTGPMLLANATKDSIRGTVLSAKLVREVEILINGEVAHRVGLESRVNSEGGFEASFSLPLELSGTSWVAARCWEVQPDGRSRFAHSAPIWFDVSGQPLRPRRDQIDFLVHHVRTEIDRSDGILPPEAIREYRNALKIYEDIASNARP